MWERTDWLPVPVRLRERAVSPVIGVILLVAITVILAAVIGAFVMGIGGEQASAPNVNLELRQDTYTVERFGADGSHEGVTHVVTRHAGGETIQRQNVNLRSNVEMEQYTDGEVGHQLGRLVGLNRSRTAGHADDPDDTFDVTDGYWNNRGQRPIAAPETSRYSWWINDAVEAHEPTNWNQMTFRDVYSNGGSTCVLSIHGRPRDGYGEPTSKIGLWKEAEAYHFEVGHADADIGWTNCPQTGESVAVDYDGLVDVMGSVRAGDVTRVVWSPPDADQSTILAEYEIR